MQERDRHRPRRRSPAPRRRSHISSKKHRRRDHVERFFLRSLPVTLRKKLQSVEGIHHH
jgi:hypothetical protein